ncbi:hypothetical protein V1525DRAFT_401903 [Lipomyces kononenkoae]|uniref:Uncharacterized protein n=1 Tax=Lipomyces kononenkoae TaxID=34357 RepID=A0ACC3T473_LIPKO
MASARAILAARSPYLGIATEHENVSTSSVNSVESSPSSEYFDKCPRSVDHKRESSALASRETSTPAEDGVLETDFATIPSSTLKEQLQLPLPRFKHEPWIHALTPMFMGIDIQLPAKDMDTPQITFGFSIHDGYYSTDFALKTRKISKDIDPSEYPRLITDRILNEIKTYAAEHLFKFVAVAFAQRIQKFCPRLCARLWLELDILPFVFNDAMLTGVMERELEDNGAETVGTEIPSCDEVADSLARKIIMFFGPKGLPRISIGYRNKVEVDNGGLIHMVDLRDYQEACSPETWDCLLRLVRELKNTKIGGRKGVRIAFFNATPQGGGVALMRHALIRLFKLLDIHATWYVPKPNPSVFRITKNNHNIIQGVADPSLRLTDAQKEHFSKWIDANFERYWATGPLDPDKPPGVDIAVFDDPQVVGLIPLAKQAGIKVIYRSHIELRSDLIKQKGSPQAGVWDFLWDAGIKDAEVFISHPVRGFVPDTVDIKKVGYMPASTDWLDGLNKDLSRWDTFYYMGLFKKQCEEVKANKLIYPMRPYICQIARFDPSKGIPDVLESYRKLREMMDYDELPLRKIPQLVIAGHGAIDDPDGVIVYDETVKMIATEEYETISSDIIIMRLGPSDQLLNCLLSNATVVLQLSHREGFEVKVSEAIHKGKPVIAYRAGGIALQIQNGRNGYLCKVGDTQAVADHMYNLLMDADKYRELSDYAKTSVSDEVHTVGNALAWLYMFNELAHDRELAPNGNFIYDLMRESVALSWKDAENRLPRILPG